MSTAMTTHTIKTLLILTLAGSGTTAAETWGAPSDSPMLGRHATADEVKAMATTVFPNGDGLPTGSGSVVRGAAIYDARCAICHGANGLGGSAESLAGAETSLVDAWPEKTIGTYWPHATTLFDFLRRSMPMDAPGSLTDDDTYAVTAYLLHLNGIVPDTTVLDRETLMRITMPNRDGFLRVYQ